jgi:hypothetical protein
MGQVKKKAFGFIVCFFTGLLIGSLIGTVIFTVLVSHRMDEHYKKIASLESIIQDKDAKLEKLEASINSYTIVLKNIEVQLIHKENEIDEMDKIDIQKVIREKYSTLLGKEVKTIDPDILVEVVDKRIFKIENKEYRVYVEKLILTEILKLVVRVELKST